MKQVLVGTWDFLFKAGMFFLCFSFLIVLVLKWLPVSWTPLMFIRVAGHEGEKKAQIVHEWISRDEIPNSLQLAVVCSEDQHYLVHHGFDFEQIQQAMEEEESGKRRRGASTISQQTAKNVFLWPSSSWPRKGFEVWFTVLIELLWSKQRIMEVYLNSIEFGPGIYGCEAASQKYFHKPARELSSAESARLAVVLPNPIRFNAGRPTGYILKRQAWAQQQMMFWGGVLKYDREQEEAPKPKRKRRTQPQEKTTP
jgi:monofunctional glycosyltransferase